MTDWHPGSGLRPGIFNITLDHEGQINHVGVGYDVVLPSGRVAHQSGYTWYSPGQKIKAPPKQVAQLQAILDHIWGKTLDHEGVANTILPTPPPVPQEEQR